MTRRKALAALGSVGLGTLLAACSGDGDSAATPTTAEVETSTGATTTVQPATTSGESAATALLDDDASCVLAVEQTEGPYWFDADAIRSDVREGREGTPLRLAVRVREAPACTPLRNAVVEIWHCDAGGVYSGFEAGAGERFLRGAQVTNADGIAEFVTVYPGWYRGRCVHIHAKVHVSNTEVLATQFYFDEAVTDEVYTAEPYASAGERDVRNESDGIFDASLTLAQGADGDERLGAITLDVRSS